MDLIKEDYSFKVVGSADKGYVNIIQWADGDISKKFSYQWIKGNVKEVYLNQELVPRKIFKEIKKQLPKGIKIPHEHFLEMLLRKN